MPEFGSAMRRLTAMVSFGARTFVACRFVAKGVLVSLAAALARFPRRRCWRTSEPIRGAWWHFCPSAADSHATQFVTGAFD